MSEEDDYGWIKIHRKILQWEWFEDAVTLQVFIYLLLNANIKPKRWRGIDINRGEIITSVARICQDLHLSPQRVRTIIKRLEKSGELTSQTTNKYTRLIICKYNSYQEQITDTNEPDNKQLTNEQQTTNKQLTNNQQQLKNDKKEKKEKNNLPTRTREENRQGGGAEFLAEYFAPERQATIEGLCISLRTSPDNLRRLSKECIAEWEAEKTDFATFSFSDLARRLLGHIRAKMRVERKNGQAEQPRTDGLGIGEFRDSQGRRTYGTSGTIVPEDAAPRPSVAHWWSDASRQWEKMP